MVLLLSKYLAIPIIWGSIMHKALWLNKDIVSNNIFKWIFFTIRFLFHNQYFIDIYIFYLLSIWISLLFLLNALLLISISPKNILFLLIFILYEKKIFAFLDKCYYLFLTYSLFMFLCSLGNSLYLFFDCSFNLSWFFLRSIIWLVLIIFLYFFDNRYSFFHIFRQKKY